MAQLSMATLLTPLLTAAAACSQPRHRPLQLPPRKKLCWVQISTSSQANATLQLR